MLFALLVVCADVENDFFQLLEALQILDKRVGSGVRLTEQ